MLSSKIKKSLKLAHNLKYLSLIHFYKIRYSLVVQILFLAFSNPCKYYLKFLISLLKKEPGDIYHYI